MVSSDLLETAAGAIVLVMIFPEFGSMIGMAAFLRARTNVGGV